MVAGLSALCLDLWTSVCLCLFALFKESLDTMMLLMRAVLSTDIGITTDTTSNHSAIYICAVLSALSYQSATDVTNIAQQLQGQSQSQSRSFKPAVLLTITVNIASEMHFNALRSLTRTCMTAYFATVSP